MATGIAKSTYLQQKNLEHNLRHITYTSPVNVYLALFTVMPAEDGTGGTEVSGNAYARQVLTFAAYASAGATGGKCVNSGAITFPTASGNWGTIVGVAVYDALTVGNMMYYGTLNANQVINTNGVFQIADGDLAVLED